MSLHTRWLLCPSGACGRHLCRDGSALPAPCGAWAVQRAAGTLSGGISPTFIFSCFTCPRSRPHQPCVILPGWWLFLAKPCRCPCCQRQPCGRNAASPVAFCLRPGLTAPRQAKSKGENPASAGERNGFPAEGETGNGSSWAGQVRGTAEASCHRLILFSPAPFFPMPRAGPCSHQDRGAAAAGTCLSHCLFHLRNRPSSGFNYFFS